MKIMSAAFAWQSLQRNPVTVVTGSILNVLKPGVRTTLRVPFVDELYLFRVSPKKILLCASLFFSAVDAIHIHSRGINVFGDGTLTSTPLGTLSFTTLTFSLWPGYNKVTSVLQCVKQLCENFPN